MDEHGNLSGLMERAKELACLYLIDEALTKEKLSDILMQISAVTPSGFRMKKAFQYRCAGRQFLYSRPD